MNYLDIIISVSLLYGLIKGYSNGIIKETTNIISMFLAIYIGVHFSKLIHPYLNLDMISDYAGAIPLIAFLIIFIITLITIKLIGELINRLTKLVALALISRLLGAIFGMIKLLVICCFLLLIATDYELIDKQTQKKSILFIPLQEVSEIIIPEINKNKKIIIETTRESTEKAKEAVDKKINSE